MPARFRLRGDRLLFLALATLLVFLSLLWFALQKSPEFSAQYFTDTALLTVLAIANGLLVLALIYVLFRNLIRLVAERRRGTLGSQFKTKLVVIFLGLTLIPSILLFVAAGKLIELSIKAVFAPEVVEMVDASKSVLDATHDRYKEQALHFAGQVAADVARRQLLSPSQRRRLEPALEERMREYEVDLIVVSAGGEASMTVVRPSLSLTDVNALPWDLVRRAQEGKPADRIDELASGRMVRAALPVPGSERGESAPAVVTVGYLIPDRVAALTAEIDRAASTYFQNKALKGHLEAEYYLILILVAVLVAFAAVWVSIALAKRITVPIQRLAEGTRAVAAGDLDFRLDVETDDEFGILVDSFNRMTRDLRTSKESEERSHRELETTNQELAERRRYM
jgi:two-component system nitrogen regulation sensor histidine kinase NtrY